MDAAGWHPDALRQHYGARAVYQITRATGAVRTITAEACTVTGNAAGDWFSLELGDVDALAQMVGAEVAGRIEARRDDEDGELEVIEEDVVVVEEED